MAMYVLVAFDDDKDAEKFVAQVQQGGGVFDDEGGGWMSYPATVRGAWKKPTKFCPGVSCTPGAKAKSGFTRGRKYGWWVCANCKRPTQNWANGDHWSRSLGTNLLPISELAPEYRGPGHMTHSGYKPKAIWCQDCGRFKFRLEPGTMCDEHPETQLTLSPMHQQMMNTEGVENNG